MLDFSCFSCGVMVPQHLCIMQRDHMRVHAVLQPVAASFALVYTTGRLVGARGGQGGDYS